MGDFLRFLIGVEGFLVVAVAFIILLVRIVLPLFIGAALGDALARALGLAINSITSYIFFAIFFVGLVSNRITVIAFDPEGDVWIGTDQGLNVFEYE